jgi:hypothetical protein
MKKKEVVISVGQALLILIDKYGAENRKVFSSSAKVASLKKMYLSGVRSQREYDLLVQYLGDPVFKGRYQVSGEPRVVNEDPSRRYFETHLAKNTLQDALNQITEKQLKIYIALMPLGVAKQTRWVYEYNKQHGYISAADVLHGRVKEGKENMVTQYAHMVAQVRRADQPYASFSVEERSKIRFLSYSSYLGVNLLGIADDERINDQTVPLPIYGVGIYSPEARGKSMKENQGDVRSQHMGLMKSYMPVPQYDVASSGTIFPYLKPVDQARVSFSSAWGKATFNRRVHPVSNSISGTILAQIRLIASLGEKEKSTFSSKGDLEIFFKLFTSNLLYNGGGHTLLEYLAPFELKEVKKALHKVIPGCNFSLDHLFREDNEGAFNRALKATIKYNKLLLNKNRMHAELEDRPGPSHGL